MTRLAGVLYICDVCGKEFFCKQDNAEQSFVDMWDETAMDSTINHHLKLHYKAPTGWTPEMCPDCARRIEKSIEEEKRKIRFNQKKHDVTAQNSQKVSGYSNVAQMIDDMKKEK